MAEQLPDDIAIVCETTFAARATEMVKSRQAHVELDESIANLTPDELVEMARLLQPHHDLFNSYMWSTFEIASEQRKAAETVGDTAKAQAYDNAAEAIFEIGKNNLTTEDEGGVEHPANRDITEPFRSVFTAIRVFRQTCAKSSALDEHIRSILEDLTPAELERVGLATEFLCTSEDGTLLLARFTANQQLSTALKTETDVQLWHATAKKLGSSIADLIVENHHPKQAKHTA